MSFPRYGPLAGRLPDGQVLEICNVSDPGVPRCAAELYNPSSGSWSQDGAASPSAEGGYAYTMLNNGQVLISGGANVFGADQQTTVPWISNPSPKSESESPVTITSPLFPKRHPGTRKRHPRG